MAEFEAYTYHAKIRNSLERAKTPINFDLEDINKVVSKLKTAAVLSNNPVFNDTFSQLAEIYKN